MHMGVGNSVKRVLLNRVCTTCTAQICVNGPGQNSPHHGKTCESQRDCAPGTSCNGIDPLFCPSTSCEEWTCACSAPGGVNGSLLGVYGMLPVEVDGEWSCACADGLEETEMPVSRFPLQIKCTVFVATTNIRFPASRRTWAADMCVARSLRTLAVWSGIRTFRVASP